MRSINEAFVPNPASGTGSMSIPVPLPAGRAGTTPGLTLGYDSGHGNGPLGIGWTLAVPAISRRTDRGLPAYIDAKESDIFIWSGAEDLVPVPGNGAPPDSVTDADHRIYRYRPRVDGQYQRIERWVNRTDPTDVHWRTISRDNQLSVFGDSESSRITDPGDPTRIFSWLLSQTRDPVGNAVVYEYKTEDSIGVDVTRLTEYTRGPADAPARQVNRYLKRIRYGNDQPLLDAGGHRPRVLTNAAIQQTAWHFEVVLDYGEHDLNNPRSSGDGLPWAVRSDPFSTYRSGFEIRTYRLCRRVLIYHHFPNEGLAADALVSSLSLAYTESPAGALLRSVIQSGHRATAAGQYATISMPPIEFGYTSGEIAETLGELDPTSLADLPVGVDGVSYRFTDLDSEGIPGILLSNDGAWQYKPARGDGQFEAARRLPAIPATTSGTHVALMDLAGVGQLDYVELSGDTARFHRRTAAGGWEPAQAFASLPTINWGDANLRFADLDGDGCTDLLITRDDHLTWYPSLGTGGFGPAQVHGLSHDENDGPRLIFADGTESVYLADMSGDGLSDLVRIRVGDISYWPNLGRGRFGARRAMEHAPRLDRPDRWDGRRVRLADVDGTGTTDIIYLGADGARVYRNLCGNAWTDAHLLRQFPPVDAAINVTAADVLGTGTTCLVWSSPWPAEARRPLQYLDLMSSTKPNLLNFVANNLGAETRIGFLPSTAYYLRDKRAGQPWVTRLPVPVWVVDTVENRDLIGRTRYRSRYAYHHGYYDGAEREFRGFASVEQWDTEEHRDDLDFDDGPWANEAAESWVPPIRTRSWFHTGAPNDVAVSRHLASEYWTPGAAGADLELPDSALPDGLVGDEVRQAYRALRGTPLRVEVTGVDGTALAHVPYQVTEQRVAVHLAQPQGDNRHAIFTVDPHEHVQITYDRVADDPRVAHDITLEVDAYGNVLRSMTVSYARFGHPTPEPALAPAVQAALDHDQHRVHAHGTQNSYTNAIDTAADYRTPMPAAVTVVQFTGPLFVADPHAAPRLYRSDELDGTWTAAWDNQIPFEQLSAADINGDAATLTATSVRITGRQLTQYRSDDLAALLEVGSLQPLALPGENYQQAFTEDLLVAALPAVDATLLREGGYVELAGQDGWWLPSGRTYLSAGDTDSAATELAAARQHFFRPRRAVDPFGATSRIDYDSYDLLGTKTTDAIDNTALVTNDYRAGLPVAKRDPNENTSAVLLDCLNTVVGTVVSGRAGEGDSATGFTPDLDDAQLATFLADPIGKSAALLASATTRFVADRTAYWRTRTTPQPSPVALYAIVRETHVSDLAAGVTSRLHHSVTYFDGLARTTQSKVQSAPGPVSDGGPEANPRWIGSGWTIYNNKGQPARVYEPFFTATPAFELNRRTGLSVTTLYDALLRVTATVHPDNTLTKTVYRPWQRMSYDANDTVAMADPSTDPDIGAAFGRAFGAADPWVSWYDQRASGQLGADPVERAANQDAANKASAHADTPQTTHLDPLGRACLSVEDNSVAGGPAARVPARTAFDAANRPLAVVDAAGRRAVENCVRDSSSGALTYFSGYDLAGRLLFHTNIDGGARRQLPDVAGQPIRNWDARGQLFRTRYDPLRRVTHLYVTRADAEVLLQRSLYGDHHPDATTRNLRGQLFRRYDGAGMSSHDSFDFAGNLIAASQQLAIRQTAPSPTWISLDWTALETLTEDPTLDLAALDAAAAPLLLTGEAYQTSSRFDAMNRVTQRILPHRSGSPVSVTEPAYDDGTLLARLTAFVRLAAPPAHPLGPGTAGAIRSVTSISYNEHGQRTQTSRGNSTGTAQAYDPATHRLTTITTTRPGAVDAGTVQDLRYTYDAVGNITRICDEADIHNAVFFRNQRVDPTAGYTYDAIYRLTQATGREHLGQTAAGLNPPVQIDNSDAPRMQSPIGTLMLNPGDGNAMGNYTETYTYDDIGNVTTLQHRVMNNSWTRTYRYVEPSQIDSTQPANRLSTTSLPGGSAPYTYDAHGNMTTMPHLTRMVWDEQDQLSATSRQSYRAGTPESTYYHYDSSGGRLRKATFGQATAGTNPVLRSERIYLGALELYRTYDAGGLLTLERETVHCALNDADVLIVETRTRDTHGTDQAPEQVQRYRYTNHLGSATLELDDRAAVISYEECFPYGSTAYQAVRSATETPKRYRYTGKERDEENDLYYHGARYYASWLGRWTACDPAGTVEGLTAFVYTHDKPIGCMDPDGRASVDAWQLNFGSAPAYRQKIIAGRQSRGISATDRANIQKAYEMWGGHGRVDAGHVGKPHVLMKAGEQGEVFAQPFRVNRQQAALERAQAGQMRRLGQAPRDTKGIDQSVPKGTPFKHPETADAFESESFKNFKHIARPNRFEELPLQKGASPSTTSSEQLELFGSSETSAIAAPASHSSATAYMPSGAGSGGQAVASEEARFGLQEAARVRYSMPSLSRVTSVLSAGVRLAGFALTVSGAWAEGRRTQQMELRMGRPAGTAALMGGSTMAFGIFAGVGDDAVAAAAVATQDFPALTLIGVSWEDHGSGPLQSIVGDATRDFLRLGM